MEIPLSYIPSELLLVHSVGHWLHSLGLEDCKLRDRYNVGMIEACFRSFAQGNS